MKKTFIGAGGLNLDISELFLDEQDYVEGKNLTFNVSKAGNQGSFKKLPSYEILFGNWIADSANGAASTNTVVQGMAEDISTGDIYFLFSVPSDQFTNGVNLTRAGLIKFATDGTPTVMFENVIGIFAEEEPDDCHFRFVNDMLVWRSSVSVFSWYANRPWGASSGYNENFVRSSGRQLNLAKEAALFVEATFVASPGDRLAESDYQFACRFVYDSGEVTPLSGYSKVVGRTTTEGFIEVEARRFAYGVGTLTFDTFIPFYVDKVVFYVRRSNDDPWFRIGEKTRDEANSATAADRIFTFRGETGAALSTRDAGQVFSAVPVQAKSLEIVDGRVMLGNVRTFNPADIDVQISDAGFDRDPSDKLLISGRYMYGVVLHDRQMRTIGVVSSFVDEIPLSDIGQQLPSIRIDFNQVPDELFYYSVARTKNLDYSNIFASYFDDIFFIYEDSNGDIKYSYNPGPAERPRVKFLALDVSASMSAGHVYGFQDGDVCLINLGTGVATSLDTVYKVLGTDGSLILLEPKFENIRDVGVSDGRFKILTPAGDQQVNIFYERWGISHVPQNSNDTIRYIVPTTSTVSGNTVEDDFFVDGDYYDLGPALVPFAPRITYSGSLDRIDANGDLTENGEVTDPFSSQALIHHVAPYITRDLQFEVTTDEGRPFLEVPEDLAYDFPNQIRFGGRVIQGLNINKINQFFGTDLKEMPNENGPIRALALTNKLSEYGAVLLCIHEREASSIYVRESEIAQTSGDVILSKTDDVLGKDNTLKGGHGTLHSRSVFIWEGQVYWWDETKRKVVRYAQDGLVPISDLGMRSFFQEKSGSCIIWQDPFLKYIFVGFEADDDCFVYDMDARRWKGQITTNPPSKGIVVNQQAVVNFRGIFYRSNGDDFNKFFGPKTGNAYNANIGSEESSIEFIISDGGLPLLLDRVTLLFQEDFIEDKLTIKPDIFLIELTNENGQLTTLRSQNFLLEEKVIYAHFLRDENSAGGIIEGDFVIGAFNKIKLTILDVDLEGVIDAFTIDYQISKGHGI